MHMLASSDKAHPTHDLPDSVILTASQSVVLRCWSQQVNSNILKAIEDKLKTIHAYIFREEKFRDEIMYRISKMNEIENKRSLNGKTCALILGSDEHAISIR